MTQDFPLSIQWSASGDSKATISRPDTGNGCEYTCNDGYIKAIDSGWASCRRARCLPGTGMNMPTYDIAPANAYAFS